MSDSAARDDEAETGAILPGRFRLDGVVARGSFGTVYRARQLAVGRDVAVKVLHADIDPASDDGRLFAHEIESVGRIDHVNVVRIFQADVTADARMFFAMELLDGRDLQRILDDDGPVAPARALALIGQLLAGLAAAHDAGLVHADVKPGNAIVVGPPAHERLVLIDFGLARLRRPEPVESVGGTPAYMAPEQLRDGHVDPRSDLFAAALVLVALLTGWRRRDAGALLPPLDAIADARLRAVVARALALDPAARFPTAAAFAHALAGVGRGWRPDPIERARSSGARVAGPGGCQCRRDPRAGGDRCAVPERRRRARDPAGVACGARARAAGRSSVW